MKADLEFAKRVSEFQICEKNLDQIKEEIRMSMMFEQADAIGAQQEDHRDPFSRRVDAKVNRSAEKASAR